MFILITKTSDYNSVGTNDRDIPQPRTLLCENLRARNISGTGFFKSEFPRLGSTYGFNLRPVKARAVGIYFKEAQFTVALCNITMKEDIDDVKSWGFMMDDKSVALHKRLYWNWSFPVGNGQYWVPLVGTKSSNIIEVIVPRTVHDTSNTF